MVINSEQINRIDTTKFSIFTPSYSYYMAMASKDKIDFIYNTSALEGNNMSYPEVQTLLEGITIGGHKLSDEQQILNQNRSVNLLFELIKSKKFTLSKEIICSLHKKVAFEEALVWGVFRTSHVNIGGTNYQPPKALLLDNIFTHGIEQLEKINHPIVRALSCFLFGAKVQFFYDGNKRTARLMMNGILLQNGYPMLNIKAVDKLEFNKQMIDFYNGGEDISKSLEYLMDYYFQQNYKFIF